MDNKTEKIFYLGAGPLAAIILGFALAPLRELTTASNFTFVYLALTIAVAEFGGTWAAVATALCSALSVDFFLTKPYMTLAMADKNDVIAFVGLATCGLIAASLGSHRGEKIAEQAMLRKREDLFHSILGAWNSASPVEPQLANVLRATRDAFPLSGAVVRTEGNAVLASSDPGDGARPIPAAALAPDTLLPHGASANELLRRLLPQPIKDGRVALTAGGRPLGWLDLWGDGTHASVESRRAVSDVASLIAILLVAQGPGARSRG